MFRILLTLSLFNLILFGNAFGQQDLENNARAYLSDNLTEYSLNQEIVDRLIITDQFTSKHNGAHHIYFQQTRNDIPVFNASLHLTITKTGKVLVTANRLITDTKKKWDNNRPEINPAQAIWSVVDQLYPSANRNASVRLMSENAGKYTFQSPVFSDSDIPVELVYVPNGDELTLCWNLEMDVTDKADHWLYNVNARTGEIVSRLNYTTYCSFDLNSFSHKSVTKCDHPHEAIESPQIRLTQSQETSSYMVFPFPGESPNHTDQAILNSPADPEASPFGWHDTDGVEGPEFTITRGNNVHAYLDEFDQDQPSASEPDGGEDLNFLFEFDGEKEAEDNKDAAVVNLFYANNRTHDLIYRFGFDEVAGNFQQNNYGKGGMEGDYVHAQAFDGGGENNANFSTPSDGNNGRMQMYLWSGGDQLRLEIKSPLNIAGLYETGKAAFGPDMDNNLIDGKVVISTDDTNRPNLGCGDMINANELNGNIALIDRGVCEFGSKVFHAEQAGAIAVMICNVEGVDGGTGDELIDMAAGAEGDKVNIPSLFVKKTTCDLIKIAIANEEEVTLTMGLQQLPGPSNRPGSFDNGVVIHEYTHGISTRLTGGPGNSGCLGNNEQMGEGWSDFYALAFTTEPGDQGTDARGIGTYASGQRITGRGIRHYPYSADMSISPVTYDFIKTTNIPHGVGEVWAAALWDLYWKFIDLYGFDPDWSDPESGNFKALVVITDAMKMQACNPGFLDGRDAILDADLVNYEGMHECMIWEVFARRGMGYFADQGDPADVVDGTENFEPKPTCIPELKIRENYDGLVVPGETIDVRITVTNHKPDSVTQVQVVENLPAGLTFVDGSSAFSSSFEDGNLVFELGTLQSNEEVVVDYSLEAEYGNYSVQKFYDDMEEDTGDWIGLNNEGDDTFWEWTDINANSGEYSWYVAESELVSDLSLIMLTDPIVIDGNLPALSFYHAFNTETLTDGGFVEYSTDYGSSWNQIGSEHFIMNAYSGPLSYSTIAIPGLEAFYGNSEGFIRSFIDLSFIKGQEVIFSFRYGTDDNTIVSAPNPGWFIDDVEYLDLKKYQRTTCVESAEGDNRCLQSEILIDSRLPDAVDETILNLNRLLIGPNPATEYVNLFIDATQAEDALIRMFNTEGQLMYEKTHRLVPGKQRISINTAQWPNGAYWLQYSSANAKRAVQLIIQ